MFPKGGLEVMVKVTGSFPIQILVVYQTTGISQVVGKIQNRKTQGSP